MKMHIYTRLYNKGDSLQGINKETRIPTPSITHITRLRNRTSHPQREFNHKLKKLDEALELVIDAELKAGDDKTDEGVYSLQRKSIQEEIQSLPIQNP